MAFLDGTGLGHLIEKLKAAFVLQSDTQTVSTIDIDSTPTASSTNLVTSGGVKSYVDGAINALPEPMVFQGTIGTSGTSSTVPSSPTEGDTYKIIEGGTSLTFTGISDTIKVGDTVIYKNSTVGWVLIPSGDEPAGTVTSITAGTGLNTTSNNTATDGGTISSSGTLYLTKSGVTAGTYQGLTVDKYGRVTAASNQNYGTYSKPSGGIPASDLASDAVPQEVFWTIYGTTTASEIQTAINSGKLVLIKTNDSDDEIGMLSYYGSTYYFFIVPYYNGLIRYQLSNDVWSKTYIEFQKTSDLVTSWNTTPSNSKYPSEKLVKDSLDAKYVKPSGGIPASDIASGVIPTIESMTNAEIDTAVNAAWVWEDDE